MTAQTFDHPFFARMWTVMSAHEAGVMKKLRKENLAGLTGRCAGGRRGHRHQLRVLSRHRDRGRRPGTGDPPRPACWQAAAAAPVPVTVIESTIETMPATEPFDAVVCSLVLCSVDDPDAVLRQPNSVLKPGGELRYFEHIAQPGWRGRLQRAVDSTFWPKMAGNCHTHRETERAITGASFAIQTARRTATMPAWDPDAGAGGRALGRAVKTA